ncbi:hypothetical protein J1605_009207 [Eschrichtius robustus]|uniref:UV-stimulated scaffold protein A n=1 Tax=Eschrichtius robustus TaxID=9764 RepID=A0AB34GX23_ESCRO|nr:hypothetical protein J1605_009207 [Eschrichtius robustus]
MTVAIWLHVTGGGPFAGRVSGAQQTFANETQSPEVLGGHLACLRSRFVHMDQKLSELVEELTTSGEPQVNPKKMKELKKICKSSEEQLGHTYHLLMAQLSQEHAEVRLSAFQVLDQLFARSHHFRMLVVSNFQEFLELTLGTDHERPLPPPREVAQKLRRAATRAVRGWNEKYGTAYKKLALGFHFLTHNKQVDFQDVDARTLAERKRAEEKQKRLDRIYKERSEQAVREMEAVLETCTPQWSAHPFRLVLLHPPAVVLPASSPDPHHWPALPMKGSQGRSTWGRCLASGQPQSRERWSARERCREGGGRPERDGGGVPPRLAAVFQKYCQRRLLLGVRRRCRALSQHESGLRVVPRTS